MFKFIERMISKHKEFQEYKKYHDWQGSYIHKRPEPICEPPTSRPEVRINIDKLTEIEKIEIKHNKPFFSAAKHTESTTKGAY